MPLKYTVFVYGVHILDSLVIWQPSRSRFGCTSKIGLEKVLFEDENLHFYRNLEASNELPVNVGQIIFTPCIRV